MNPATHRERNPRVRRISVVGLGKLGAPMLACLAAAGYYVVGADVDPHKVADVCCRVAPVSEPGLGELLQRHSFYVDAVCFVKTAVWDSDLTFIVVATPSEPTGGFSLEYVLPVCEEIGRVLREKEGFHVVALTSTVMPGATDGPVREVLERVSGKRCGVDFGLCYNPEFIALGSVIRDFCNPDLVLIGESDTRSGELLAEIYDRVCANRPAVARMSAVNAELTKLALNTYVTTKISYANTLAALCERLPGGDVDVVTTALGADGRIGSRCLKGGASYGGPCFPRDNRALASLAESLGVSAAIPRATDQVNQAQLQRLAIRVWTEVVGDVGDVNKTVGILGLTYKPGTDVTEQAVGFLLAQLLVGARLSVVAYDPAARAKPDKVKLADSVEELIAQTELIVLATLWPEFLNVTDEVWFGKTVVDPWRVLRHLRNVPGVRYIGGGLGE